MSPRSRVGAAALMLVVLLLAGCSTPTPREPTPPSTSTTTTTPVDGTVTAAPTRTISLTPLVRSGLSSPILVVGDPEGKGRLFVAQQDGRVMIVDASTGAIDPVPFLDVSLKTREGGEQGLLGFAFSPRYLQDGVAIGSYTGLEGSSVLARYHRGPDGRLLAASEEIFLHVHQPYPNHNGGNVVFGPDGYLYFGLGDGGSGGDPDGNGQNKDALLGSMLRIDVSGAATGYSVPADNPYHTLVWAKGLRNPWRFSFDRATGDLWIGDVGQDAWEEIDYQPHDSKGGENYGWNVWEGTHRYSEVRSTLGTPVAPVAEYSHEEGGCSVVGGFVYRGSALPALVGTYLFGDYCSGKIWGLRHESAGWNRTLLLASGLAISSFGEDAAGNVWVVDHDGGIYGVGPAA